MRKIAAFDFDGTLTQKDTFLQFVKFAVGRRRFTLGFLLHAPLLIFMKLGLYPNWKAKRKVFAYFFKGMNYDEFAKLGRDFADVIDTFTRQRTLSILKTHIGNGDKTFVISASVDEWVRPWCERQGIRNVLDTLAEIDSDGRLSGRFISNNCYGQEKVNRLLEVEPDRNSYILYAYGDSRGDKELLAFADKGIYV